MKEELLNSVNAFLEELELLIKKDSFKQFGFAIAHEHHQWLDRVTELKDHLKMQRLDMEENLLWNLQSLGLSYAISKSKETSTIIEFKTRIENIIKELKESN